MAFLGDLIIRLRANTGDFVGDMGRAAYQTEKAMKQMSRAASNFNRSLQVLGVSLSGYALVRGFRNVVDAGDNFAKMSQRVGVSAQTLSELEYAARRSNVPMETLEQSVAMLTKSMTYSAYGLVTYQRYFKTLGVEIKDTSGKLRPVQDVLGDIADKFANMADGAKKSSLAALLFSTQGLKLIPLLNEGRSGIEALRMEAEKLGIVWSNEDANAAQDLNNKLITLGAQFDHLKLTIVTSIVPTLSDMAKRFNDAKMAGEGWIASLSHAIVGSDYQIAQQQLVKLTNSRLEMERQIARLRGNPAGFARPAEKAARDSLAQIDEQIKAAQAVIKLHEQGLNTPVLNNVPGAITEAFKLPTAGDMGIANAMETKKYAQALQALEQQLGKLKDSTQTQATLYQTEKGSLVDLSEAHKQHLLQIARLVDRYKQAQEAAKQWVAMQDELQASVDAANDSFASFSDSNRQYVQDMQFQTSLIGKTAEEQRRLTELRKIDEDALRAMSELGENATSAMIARIYAEAQAQKDAVTKTLDDQLKAQRSWLAGAKSAYQDYVDSASDAAAQTKKLFADVYQGLEDVLTQWLSTGKADWRAFGDMVISELARMEARAIVSKSIAPVLQPVMTGLASGIGSLFGFAQGGSFTVGGTGGVDSQVVAFRATPGEPVTVGNPGQGSTSIVLSPVYNIDSRSDRASIMAAIAAGNRTLRDQLSRELRSGGRMAREVGRV